MRDSACQRLFGLTLLALAACGAPSGQNSAAPANATGTAGNASTAAGAAPVRQSPMAAPQTAAQGNPPTLSCSAEIGAAAAARRVKVCRDVSPATHPPCNAANSCAMIEDEIARSCALFDGQGAPMAGCGPDPKSSAAAVAVVQRYYSAINARDFGTAWQQWGDDGPPGQSITKFEAGFVDTRAVHVTIGKLEPAEGGAGSIYQTVPVAIDSMLKDGTRQRFVGDYVVRRVNGVDGATSAQLRWHIDSAHLKATRPQ